MISDELFEVLTQFEVVPNATIIDLGFEPPRVHTSEDANTRIKAIANGLTNLGLPENPRIAVVSKNSYEFICLWLAISQAGFTIIPINYKLPKEQLEYCLEDGDTHVVFYESEFKDLIPAKYKSYEILSNEYESILNYDTFVRPKWDKDAIHCIMYTSGTTGSPKGVVTTYENKMWSNTHFVHANESGPPTTYLHVSPLYHLAGSHGLINTLSFSGSKRLTTVIMPKFDAKQFIKLVEKYRVTDLRLVSPMMAMILAERQLLTSTDVSSVRVVSLTSSHAPEKMQKEIRAFFRGVRVINNPYGLTETGPIFGGHPQKIPKPIGSVGYPYDNVEVRIVDGVLQVRSKGILVGYHKKDDMYKKSMTEDGFFITGDLFRVNKYGFYFYMGRADDMFKSGGEKIYPTEIEAILDRHPDVAMSAVVGVPDDVKGFKPYAFVQLKVDKTDNTEQAIKEFAIKNVASYQIPRQVWVLDDLPKTQIGKIDRRLLTDMAKELLAKSK